MNLQAWLDQMQTLMKVLNADRPYVQDHEHFIGPAPDPEIMNALEREFKLEQAPRFVEFHRAYGGVVSDALDPDNCLQLDGVGPGYYLWTTQLLLKTKETGPLAINGEHAGNIIPIGHNGHEDDFAVRTDGIEEVLLLQEGRIEDAVYWEREPVIVVASDFNGFLERMLADTQAALRGDKNWKYMTSWED